MDKPEDTEQDKISACARPADCRTKPCAKEGPGSAVTGRVIKDFDEGECNEHQQDQAKDDQAIPWPVQKTGELPRTYDSPAESED